MPDLSRAVTYRGFALNTVTVGENLAGCVIDSWVEEGPNATGYTEKRARGDGEDAGDVYLSGKRIRLSGSIYATDHLGAYDLKAQLRAALSAPLAYRDSPDDLGFLPLAYSEPSNNEFVTTKSLVQYVRPLGLSITEVRDRMGGTADLAKAAAFQWTATLLAADPVIYGADRTISAGVSGTSGSPTITNYGTYPCPLSVVLESDDATERTFTLTGLNADITITVPAGPCVVTWDGKRRVLTVAQDGNTTVRMDLIEFSSEEMYPEVPAGDSDIAWTITAALDSGSISFTDAYA